MTKAYCDDFVRIYNVSLSPVRLLAVVAPFVVLYGLLHQCSIDGHLHLDTHCHHGNDTSKLHKSHCDLPGSRHCNATRTATFVLWGVYDVAFVRMADFLTIIFIKTQKPKCFRFSIFVLVFVHLTECATTLICALLMQRISGYDVKEDRITLSTIVFILCATWYSLRTVIMVFVLIIQTCYKRFSSNQTPIPKALSSINQIYAVSESPPFIDSLDNNHYLQRCEQGHPYWSFVSSLIHDTWVYHSQLGYDASNLTHTSIKLRAVYKICNGKLLQKYVHNVKHRGDNTGVPALKESILTLNVHGLANTSDCGGNNNCEEIETRDTPRDCGANENVSLSENERLYLENKQEQLQEDEIFLFHGTKHDNISGIIKNGFDISRNVRRLYGKGIYLAESSQKADQYADDKYHREITNLAIFVVRTRLGHVTDYCPNCTAVGYDTIVAGKGKRFREFVATDGKNLYPEFLVIYDRAKGDIDTV